jgi:hypothetical protein
MRNLADSRSGALRLVAGDRAEETADAARRDPGIDAPTPTARPSERCEPWPVGDQHRLRSLAAAAAERGISLELAIGVVVERSLLADDLAARRLDEVAARLDAEAAHASVTIALSEPLSTYLCALTSHDRGASRSLPQLIALPMRLTERIGASGPAARLDATLLQSALSWERAAVLEGRTMSEWATLKALELGG